MIVNQIYSKNICAMMEYINVAFQQHAHQHITDKYDLVFICLTMY